MKNQTVLLLFFFVGALDTRSYGGFKYYLDEEMRRLELEGASQRVAELFLLDFFE
jgi:hypothetical protein